MRFKSVFIKYVIILIHFFLIPLSASGENQVKEEQPDDYTMLPVLVEGNTAFALALYDQLQKKNEGNLFFSPYSISTALAMAYAGAKGSTKTQMADVLHFKQIENVEQVSVSSVFDKLLEEIKNDQQGDQIKLNIANALWGHSKPKFSENFISTLKHFYGVQPRTVDFEKEHEKARSDINKWVAKQTNDKIKHLIKEGVIDSFTRLVLVNAIYFKGNWANSFEPNQTQPADFWSSATEPKKVPMMNQKAKFSYLEKDEVQVLKLAYASQEANQFSMTILLPKQRDGLAQLEKMLTVEKLKHWEQGLRLQEVKVSLPKFKLNTYFQLSQALKDMGMRDAFAKQADFSGFYDSEKEDLFLKDVIHQAFVEVNEEGTEAAAATAVFATTRGMPPKVPTFNADHPFIFLIRHEPSKSILFLGRVGEL
jgi:serine protease inhibitor